MVSIALLKSVCAVSTSMRQPLHPRYTAAVTTKDGWRAREELAGLDHRGRPALPSRLASDSLHDVPCVTTAHCLDIRGHEGTRREPGSELPPVALPRWDELRAATG